MQFHIFLDVQSDIPYAHPQRTETVHMHNVSKRILPQFRSQEGNRKSFTKYNCFYILIGTLLILIGIYIDFCSTSENSIIDIIANNLILSQRR